MNDTTSFAIDTTQVIPLGWIKSVVDDTINTGYGYIHYVIGPTAERVHGPWWDHWYIATALVLVIVLSSMLQRFLQVGTTDVDPHDEGEKI
jgi:hypothetical protein